MNILKEYRRITKAMVEQFIDVYYTYDDGSKANYYIVWEDENMHMWSIEIADVYRDIEQIYQSLANRFDFDKMMDWKDYQIRNHPNQMKVNFYNYCKYDTFNLDWIKWTTTKR